MEKRVTMAVALIITLALTVPAWALTDIEKLGGLIYRDTNLSINENQSCMTCHHPSAGFADPVNLRDPENFPVSEGSIAGKYGGRNAPTSAYAGFSPIFGWDNTLGEYVGGMFWDGRATGAQLDDPLAEQARGPFQNPVEMGLTPADVVSRVAVANYAALFLKVYPDTDWTDIAGTYNNIARAIAAFERSTAVTRFNSKFDLFWRECTTRGIDVSTINESTDPTTLPRDILSTGELKGLALFNGKAGCAGCHASADFEPGVVPPLFTNYTYDNVGIPTNPKVYELAGGSPPDLGLGGRLDAEAGEVGKFIDQWGKFKVPTLRNVAKSTPYGHNGYFISLNELVNFYNTRDLPGSAWYDIPPEVPENVNTIDIGNLGLTPREETYIVSFLKTLTDHQ